MKKINFLILILTLALILPNSVFAIGMMTKPIIIDNALRGEIIQETLTIDGIDKDASFELTAGGEIKNWAKFYKIDDLENPITTIQISANSRINAVVKFTVPEDAPNKTYEGTVAVLSAPEKDGQSEEMSVAVGLRIDREVSITVTDKEIIGFSTAIIPENYNVNPGKLLKIKVIFDNQGNVSIKPDIQLKILKDNTVVHNAVYMYPETEEPAKPRERKTIENFIQWSTNGQEKGYYRAEAKVLLNDEIKDEQSFRFTIGYGTSGFLAAVNWLGGGNLLIGWFVVGAFFVILAGVLTLFYKKPELLKIAIRKVKSIF